MDFLRSLLAAITWNGAFEDEPSGGDDPSYGDDEIRNLKEAVRERFTKEHKMDLAVGTAGLDGWHRPGTAVVYFQASEPTTRPDGVTALSANDNGRLWIRSSDYRVSVYEHGTGWVNMSTVNGAANLMSGDNEFTGDNSYSGDNTVTGSFDFTDGALIIENRTADPAAPETGRVWLRTDLA